MDNNEELQELNLDDILSEFHDQSGVEPEAVEMDEELSQLLGELPGGESMQAVAQQAEKAPDAEPTAGTEKTQRLETLEQMHPELMGGRTDPAAGCGGDSGENSGKAPREGTGRLRCGLHRGCTHSLRSPFPSAGVEEKAGGRPRKALL